MSFLTALGYASAVYTIAPCMSVSMKSMFYRNGKPDGDDFWHGKNEYLQAKITAYVFMELCPKVRTQKKISSRHIDRYKCSRIGFSTCPTASLGVGAAYLDTSQGYHRHSRASLVKSTLHMPVCLSVSTNTWSVYRATTMPDRKSRLATSCQPSYFNLSATPC